MHNVVFLPYLVQRSNDEFDDSLFLCFLYFLSLFCVSTTNLFCPVLPVFFYRVAEKSKTDSLQRVLSRLLVSCFVVRLLLTLLSC
jgi:hypothetical protein